LAIPPNLRDGSFRLLVGSIGWLSPGESTRSSDCQLPHRNYTMMLRSAATVVQEEVPSVQGKQASSYEYNVAWALEKTQIPYIFQFEFFGGRDVRGGLVVDFLALTHPLSTPIWVNGGFWHKGKRAAEDEYQQTLLFFVARGELNRPVVLWDQDCNTKEAALSAIRREFY